MITTREIYWAAGFLDGEGSFGMTSGWNPGRKHKGVVVSASQKDRELLDRLVALFGGRISLASASPNRLGGQCLRWHVTGPQAAGLMMTLFPLLSKKRRSTIARALAIWRTGRSVPGFAWKDNRCPRGHSKDYLWRGSYFCRTCRTTAAAQRRSRLRLAAGL